MNFNSKETYLAYRADWKQRYLAQVAAIRAGKQGVRDANRIYAKDHMALSQLWTSYIALRKAREKIEELSLELANARIEAGRQMHLQPESSGVQARFHVIE